jgi:murein L,D-transpeptidase YafK
MARASRSLGGPAPVALASLLAVVAACALPALARGSAPLVLPERQVFPGGDGASPATLDQPLSALLQAYRDRTGRRTFRKHLVVHKARRRLDVFADETIVKSYLVELGSAPAGDKRAKGDRRTPEGELFLCSVNRVSQFTRFLALAYPSPAAASAGVAAGRVPAAVERAVRAAHAARDRCPPQETALGGAVGIHGRAEWERRADGYALWDWTWGCVAVRDQDILELFEQYAEVGLPVRIEAE